MENVVLRGLSGLLTHMLTDDEPSLGRNAIYGTELSESSDKACSSNLVSFAYG